MLVELLLVARREDLARLDVLDAVLGDREAAADRVLPQRDVVRLRAREVLEQIAVAIRRDDAQVEPEPVVRDDRGLRLALRLDLGDPVQAREVVRQRDGIVGCGDDVEIANRLCPAADRAGLGDLVARGMLTEDLDDGLDRRKRHGQQRSLLLRLLVECLQDPLLGLRPEPGQGPEAFGLGRLAQLVERRDAELLPDPARGLRPERGQAQELGHAGGDLLLAPRQRLDLARVDDLDDLALDRLADPGQVLRVAVDRELRDRPGSRADLVGRPSIREHAELLLAVELEQIGEQVELFGHIGVPRQSCCHLPIIWWRPGPTADRSGVWHRTCPGEAHFLAFERVPA